jgi:hypothetical protein
MTGLQGQPLDAIVTRFFGNLKRWPKEPDGLGTWTQPEILAIAKHISETGNCLWHAQTIVKGWKICHCAVCNGTDPRRAQ